MCLNIGTTNNHHFPFGINGKVVVLGVPILKHFRVRNEQHSLARTIQTDSCAKTEQTVLFSILLTVCDIYPNLEIP